MVRAGLGASVIGFLAVGFLVCGCSSSRSPASYEGVAAAHRQGTVYGGQQPVSGASVQLYAVGTNGDGSPATPLLSPAATTNQNGVFNITGTYSCPSGNPLVYIVATGGNPGLPAGSSNPDISLMAALGPCGNLTASTFIVINELTTVGAVYPLAAFMTSPSAIGSGTGDAAALANAFTLASELVNTATGTAPGTGVPAGTTVPVAQINTIADILASCINSAAGTAGDGSACGSLFAMTTPTTTPATAPATDTIGALMNLANNPTLNTAALYNLASPTAPFEPMQTVTPPDLGVRLVVPSGFSVSPGPLDFGSLTTGFTSAGQGVTLTNSGSTGVLLNGLLISGTNAADFAVNAQMGTCAGFGDFLPPGNSCTVQVTFTPSAVGSRNAWLEIDTNSANPVISVQLIGQGAAPAVAGPVTVSPTSLNFTEFGVAQSVTLTNFGSGVLTINGFSISNGFAQTNNCGTSLQPQSICTIAVTQVAAATNESVGSINGVLSVIDDAAAGPQTVNLSYVSNGVSSSAAALNFGGWSIGATGELGILLSLPQKGDSLDLSISGPNASDFSLPSNSCIFAEGVGCNPLVNFSPSALGARTATLNLVLVTPTNFPPGTPVGSVSLIGSGQPAGVDFVISNSRTDLTLNSYAFGGDYVNTSRNTTFTITNTGTLPVAFDTPVSSGANASYFSGSDQCGTLAVGLFSTCILTVTSTPGQLGPVSGTVTLTDTTGAVQRSVVVTDTGSPTAPTIAPSPVNVPGAQINMQGAAQAVTITAFDDDPITASVTSPFVLTQGNSCAQTPCTLYVAFAPTSAGTTSGELTVEDNSVQQGRGAPLSSVILPTGSPVVGLSPGSLTFSPRIVGSTSIAQVVMLSNTGNAVLNVSGISLVGANPGDYVLTNACGATVAVGGSCSFSVSFSPTVAGTRTAAVQILSNATSSPDMVQLTGMAQ